MYCIIYQEIINSTQLNSSLQLAAHRAQTKVLESSFLLAKRERLISLPYFCNRQDFMTAGG